MLLIDRGLRPFDFVQENCFRLIILGVLSFNGVLWSRGKRGLLWRFRWVLRSVRVARAESLLCTDESKRVQKVLNVELNDVASLQARGRETVALVT